MERQENNMTNMAYSIIESKLNYFINTFNNDKELKEYVNEINNADFSENQIASFQRTFSFEILDYTTRDSNFISLNFLIDNINVLKNNSAYKKLSKGKELLFFSKNPDELKEWLYNNYLSFFNSNYSRLEVFQFYKISMQICKTIKDYPIMKEIMTLADEYEKREGEM